MTPVRVVFLSVFSEETFSFVVCCLHEATFSAASGARLEARGKTRPREGQRETCALPISLGPVHTPCALPLSLGFTRSCWDAEAKRSRCVFFPLLLLTAFILERRIFPRVQIKPTIKPQLFCVKSRKRACAWTGKGTRRMVRETRHLWVGNLPEHVREEKIVEYFKRWVGLLFVLKSLLLTLARGLRFARVTGKKQQEVATSSEFPPHTTSKSTHFHLVGPLKEETTRCGATISIN